MECPRCSSNDLRVVSRSSPRLHCRACNRSFGCAAGDLPPRYEAHPGYDSHTGLAIPPQDAGETTQAEVPEVREAIVQFTARLNAIADMLQAEGITPSETEDVPATPSTPADAETRKPPRPAAAWTLEMVRDAKGILRGMEQALVCKAEAQAILVEADRLVEAATARCNVLFGHTGDVSMSEARHETPATREPGADIAGEMIDIWASLVPDDQDLMDALPGDLDRNLAMWRAYIAAIWFNFSIPTLIGTLETNTEFRRACGFERVPLKVEFTRFTESVAEHKELVPAQLALTAAMNGWWEKAAEQA